MKYLKTFESFSPINEEEEIIGKIKDIVSGKSAYSTTIAFLDDKKTKTKVDDKEVIISDKVIELWKEIKDSGKAAKDPANLPKVDLINRLGLNWAKQNKKTTTEGEYNYNAIDTVMKGEWGRKYHGGVDVTTGE